MGLAHGVTTKWQATKGIVQDGLVLNLDAGVKESYSSGSTWSDLNGGNDGTLVNDCVFNKEKGGGILLDGTDDHIRITDFDLDNIDVSFSVALRVDSISDDRDIISKGPHNQNHPILCWCDRSVSGSANVGAGNQYAISCLTYDGDTQLWVASPSNSVTVDEIFILDLTIDASAGTLSMYKNGSLLASYTNANYDGMGGNAEHIRLGVDNGINKDLGGMYYFFRIYTKCLSANEVAQNFNVMRHRFGV